MMSKPLRGTGLLLTFLSLTIVGCGETGEVAGPEATGTVTLDGYPLTQGDLSFFPVGNGSSAQAAIDSNGNFRVGTGLSATGIAPGEYKVTVESWEESSDEENEGEPISLVPVKYTQEKSTDLTITVTEAGPNEFNLALTSK